MQCTLVLAEWLVGTEEATGGEEPLTTTLGTVQSRASLELHEVKSGWPVTQLLSPAASIQIRGLDFRRIELGETERGCLQP